MDDPGITLDEEQRLGEFGQLSGLSTSMRVSFVRLPYYSYY